MIITCPSCNARYVVDAAKIGPSGRTVKCAKCGHAWAQAAPPPDADAAPLTEHPTPPPRTPPPPPPEDEGDEDFDTESDRDFRSTFEAAMGRDSEKPEPAPAADRRERSNLPVVPKEHNPWAARLAWLLLIAVVAGVLGGAVYFRDTVMDVLPASQKLYDAIGMTPAPIEERLGVRGVEYSYSKSGTTTMLTIEGELVNLSDIPSDVPDMRVLFLDDAGAAVKRWTFPAPEKRMLPGEIVKFTTSVEAPPGSAKRINVGFDANGK